MDRPKPDIIRPMQENGTLLNLGRRTQEAVAHYWQTRSAQRQKQRKMGKLDQGLRGAVTGGAQMDGFIHLFTDLICDAGVARECLFCERAMELPGFFRPTKEWDLVVGNTRRRLLAPSISEYH